MEVDELQNYYYTHVVIMYKKLKQLFLSNSEYGFYLWEALVRLQFDSSLETVISRSVPIVNLKFKRISLEI